DAQLFLVSLGLWLNGDRNHWRRKINRFQNDLLLFVAQRVAGINVFQSNHRANIAGVNFINFFALVSMHLQQPADTLACTLAGVVHVAARLQNARIDADVVTWPTNGSDMILNASAENG